MASRDLDVDPAAEHARARALAATRVDFELEAAELAELEAHLTECSACRAHADRLTHDARALAALPMVDAPDRVGRRVVAGRARPAGGSLRTLMVALSLAGLMLVPLAGATLLRVGAGCGFCDGAGGVPIVTPNPSPSAPAASPSPSASPSAAQPAGPTSTPRGP